MYSTDMDNAHSRLHTIPAIPDEIAKMLDEEAKRINNPDFIDNDPVQFPRRYSDLRDIELTAFFTSAISWGNRKMILKDVEKMLDLMGHEPYSYLMDKGYEDLPDKQNIHRTLFTQHFKRLMRAMHEIYRRHGSLDAFAASLKAGESEYPSWDLAEAVNAVMADVNDGPNDSYGLPQFLKNSALKRFNMMLRWLVRDDGIVDMGIWKSIPKSKLYIPLDLHVGNTARALGLLNRKSDDRRSAVQLTQALRTINPDDPTLYDFALFGLGIESKNAETTALQIPLWIKFGGFGK